MTEATQQQAGRGNIREQSLTQTSTSPRPKRNCKRTEVFDNSWS